MKIKQLSIKNFGAIETEEFNFDGNDAVIKGTNGVGKTTVANAFSWLFFNSDIDGKRMDNIVPVINGEVRNDLTPTVIAEVEINGETYTFEKTSNASMKKDEFGIEQYTSTRRTKQLINNIPYKVTEYDNFISDIIDYDTFKLLSNLNTFQLLNWKDKRNILFDLTDEITPSDVINANNELSPILELINAYGRDMAVISKTLFDELKNKTKSLKDIPLRVSTLKESIKKVDHSDVELEQMISDKQKELNLLKTDKGVFRKLELENELKELKWQRNVEHTKIERDKEDKLHTITQKINLLKSDVNINKERLKKYTDLISEIDVELNKLRKDWAMLNSKELELKTKQFELPNTDELVCDCCNQKIQNTDEYIKLKEEAFNISKAEQLEQVAKDKETLSAKGKNLNERKDQLEKERDKFVKANELFVKDIELAERNYDQIKDKELDLTPLEQIDEKIQNVQNKLDDDIEEMPDNKERITELNTEINRLYEFKSYLKINEENETKIEQLLEDEKLIRTKASEIKRNLDLIETYNKTFAEVATNKINSMFNVAKFKMFDVQKNGSIKETCEVTVNDIPYDKGLNNAMKINVSLEIIDVLSKHYGFYAPVFIDNAESVVDLLNIQSQQIALVVSESHNKLELIKK